MPSLAQPAGATRLPNPGLVAAAALAAGLVLLPLGVTLAQAAGAGWQTAQALLLRPLVGALLLNTLVLIACTVTFCAVIGTAAAWAVERTDLPGKKFWGVLVVVPLAIPPFITSYAWISLDPGLENFAGALLVSPSPITRWSICRWRRPCGRWTRRWRKPPVRSAIPSARYSCG